MFHDTLIAVATAPATAQGDAAGFIESARAWVADNGPQFVTNLVVSLIILVIGAILIKAIRGIIASGLERSKKLNDLLRNFLVNITGKLLWVVVWLLVLSQMGVAVGPLIAGLGVMGFILGFAFQDSLGNFAAGLMILANDPFKVGEYVEVAGHAGSVQEVNIMATTITTPDNKKITIPNRLVWGASIVNYSTTGTRRVDMTVGISYGADIGKARDIILDILKADERVLDDPAPLVEVVEMADSSVNLVVRPWSKTSDYWGLFFACQRKIKEEFDANGIEIPFPQRVVHMVKGEG